MFREVSVVEVREVLRLWVRGHGLREIARLAGVDRKTVRRHVTAAVATGLDPGGGEALLTDAAVGAVLVTMRGGRPPGRGGGWEELAAEHQFIEERLKEELTLTKVHVLLRRRGCTVPYRTLHRFCVAEFGFGRDRSTVRVADCEPGTELQVDYGRMGLLFDPFRQRRRVAWCLIFTSVFSRHMFSVQIRGPGTSRRSRHRSGESPGQGHHLSERSVLPPPWSVRGCWRERKERRRASSNPGLTLK